MLTGISKDGTMHKDQLSLATELKLTPLIELPNDSDPSGEPIW